MMKIAISGATGFIGMHLTAFLIARGHEVIALERACFQTGNEERLVGIISTVDVVINLAGAPINRRWTQKYKQELYDSRVVTTRTLVRIVNQTDRVRLFISASAVGYYSSTGKCHDEYSGIKGDGFLSGLCNEWEIEARQIKDTVRLVITRFGMVLSSKGGAWKQLSCPVRMGLGTIIAPGSQPLTWISLIDLLGAMAFIIENLELRGIFNFTVPEKITNSVFMYALVRHYHAWGTLQVPTFVLRLRFGEGAEFLTQGQCVSPARLLEAGFRFHIPTIEDFLKSL